MFARPKGWLDVVQTEKYAIDRRFEGSDLCYENRRQPSNREFVYTLSILQSTEFFLASFTIIPLPPVIP